MTSFNGFARMQESVFPTSAAETGPHPSFSDREDHWFTAVKVSFFPVATGADSLIAAVPDWGMNPEMMGSAVQA